jgi:hypothetical protein
MSDTEELIQNKWKQLGLSALTIDQLQVLRDAVNEEIHRKMAFEMEKAIKAIQAALEGV